MVTLEIYKAGFDIIKPPSLNLKIQVKGSMDITPEKLTRE